MYTLAGAHSSYVGDLDWACFRKPPRYAHSQADRRAQDVSQGKFERPACEGIRARRHWKGSARHSTMTVDLKTAAPTASWMRTRTRRTAALYRSGSVPELPRGYRFDSSGSVTLINRSAREALHLREEKAHRKAY